MRFTVLGQMVKGAWSDSTAVEKPLGMLDRAQWRLWHGDAPRTWDMIDDPADEVADALDATPTSAALRQLAAAVGEFAT
jgi:hypothetical protein